MIGEIEIIVEIDDEVLLIATMPEIPAVGDFLRINMRLLCVSRKVWRFDDAIPNFAQVHIICEEVSA